MTALDPRDWPGLPDWLDPHERRRSPQEANREVLERCCMSVAFCLCFAAIAPVRLMPFVFAGLLFLAGIASVSLAVLRGERPLVTHLTAWDEAAFLFTATLGLRLWLERFPAE
ncbi:hypothetical protein [Microvirga arsenatis]|uniref:DUF4345 domain-containing protein n=1 Tax=Microvirga arsenatis TaxID=2692265 RepID=A0ABW9Z4Y6_9HYPH|nr:hypothetical protein [Microvirga arsenatis]NBJ13451.1 hypothetical protein [Microvirga arsenatis]NBJ27011.1 hypothetical protein [Microvirga arsenatis]